VGGYYDRQGAVLCEATELAEGEVLTLFSLSSARWNAHVDPFPQHTMLFFHTDTNASATELVEVLPESYGVWVLANASADTPGGYKPRLPVNLKGSHLRPGSAVKVSPDLHQVASAFRRGVGRSGSLAQRRHSP